MTKYKVVMIINIELQGTNHHSFFLLLVPKSTILIINFLVELYDQIVVDRSIVRVDAFEACVPADWWNYLL